MLMKYGAMPSHGDKTVLGSGRGVCDGQCINEAAGPETPKSSTGLQLVIFSEYAGDIFRHGIRVRQLYRTR